MKVSKNGKIFTAAGEGLVRSPYLDVANVWTVGFGHTGSAGGPDPAKMQRHKRYKYKYLLDLFDITIKKYEKRVNKYITVPLEQHQFDALVSFDYNTGGISNSTLTRYINAGKSNKLIINALMMWVKITKKGKRVVSPGLVRRRREEAKLFTKGDYGSYTTLEYQTNGRGRILWKSATKINLRNLL